MIRLQEKDFDSLSDFYTAIKKCHEDAHGVEYTAQHNVIQDKASECETYRELGIMQGATAAAAALAGYKSLDLIDIDVKPFRTYEYLFEDYEYTLTARSSIDYTPEDLDPVDFLLIDSRHVSSHLEKELKIHAQRVNKYILFHDTFSIKSLQNTISQFLVLNYKEWELETYYQENVGYTLIKRIGNA